MTRPISPRQPQQKTKQVIDKKWIEVDQHGCLSHCIHRTCQSANSRKEISHVIASGTPIEKDENATPYPCEVIFHRVGLRSLYVVIGINHADRIKIVVTAYESKSHTKERKP